MTLARLDAVGVTGGWRCWEVGAGGASVPTWLAERVGPGGAVVATDIDTTWLYAAASDRVEVRVHDVGTDDAPGAGFDLVHARLVLVHVPARAEALRRMVGSLRPGGWLVIEDFDSALVAQACPDVLGEDQRRANVVRAGFLALLAARRVDLEYGRKLPRLLRDAGLCDVHADAHVALAHPLARLLEAANTAQVASELVARCLASRREIDEHLAALDQARIDVALPPLVCARGRRR